MNAIFDLSFRNFLTAKLVRFVYLLQLVMIAVWALIMLVGGFKAGFGQGVLMLIAVPIGAAIMAMLARMFAEVMIVIFRGVELLGQIEQHQRSLLDEARREVAG